MTTPVRIALLGAGRIGRLHAELISRRVPGAALAGVFDLVDAAADEVAAEFGCRRYASAAEAHADPEADAVAICTSTDTHVDALVEAAAAGKPIFCEKPLSLDLAEVDRALAAVEAAGVPLLVGFNRRFDPSHAAVRRAVEDGSVGEVHLVRITSRDPAPPPLEYIRVSGGIFRDMTIHDFDMARFVTGSDVVEVHATGAVRVDPAIGEAGDLDTVVVVLTHADGTITTIDNSRRAVYGYDQRVEVFGSGGMAASDNPLVHTTTVRDADGARQATLPWFFIERYIPSYVAEWEAFVAMVRDGVPSPVDGRDGRAPLVMGLAALRSVAEGRPVRCEEIG
ncbi:MAG: inositol 2-dehydrogenase [Actinomyces sp.]|nr:MAG: inositol 2-dehydrogenase [Actinomyces sp.]